MAGLFRAIDPSSVKHLVITPNKAPLADDVECECGLSSRQVYRS